MVITREMVARKLIDYLHHRIGLTALVDWAEDVMQEGELDEPDFETLRDIVSRLGLADVKAFGLTWEECETFLKRLGYQVHIEVVEGA